MKKHIYCISYNSTYPSHTYGEQDRVCQNIWITHLDTPILSNDSTAYIQKQLAENSGGSIRITAINYLGHHKV